jgi:RNA polymerase sigma-70 factor (ECF subfamily)
VLSGQRGNETALKELHDLWQADLRRFIAARIGGVDGVDEIASEVWLAIARSLHRLDDPACFPRWVFCIAERRSSDWIRQRTRARRHEALAVQEADRLAPSEVTPVEASGEMLRLREAIEALPAPERELIHLFYALSRSVAEIAEILSVPAGTVKSRLFAVRESLKRKLERKRP